LVRQQNIFFGIFCQIIVAEPEPTDKNKIFAIFSGLCYSLAKGGAGAYLSHGEKTGKKA